MTSLQKLAGLFSYWRGYPRGAKPSDIPSEQPTRIELVINIKTAKTLGIKIPNSILLHADKVIESWAWMTTF